MLGAGAVLACSDARYCGLGTWVVSQRRVELIHCGL